MYLLFILSVYMFPPSVLAHIVNGIVLLIAIVLFFHYYTKMDNNKIVCTTLLLSIAIGIHGLSHLGLEMHYGYNPLKMMT